MLQLAKNELLFQHACIRGMDMRIIHVAASQFLVPNQIVLRKNLRCKEELGELSPCSKLSKQWIGSTSKVARPPVLTDKACDKASYKVARPPVLTKHLFELNIGAFKNCWRLCYYSRGLFLWDGGNEKTSRFWEIWSEEMAQLKANLCLLLGSGCPEARLTNPKQRHQTFPLATWHLPPSKCGEVTQPPVS